MDTLYHYCSTETFLAIAESKSIRLSSLSLSNDTDEGKLVARVFSRMAEQDALGPRDTEQLKAKLNLLEELSDGLGFCLSEDGDLLSQWRGYAADATGVAIGFSRSYLEWLQDRRPLPQDPPIQALKFRLKQVVYETEQHEATLRPTYEQVKKLIEQGAYRNTALGILAERPSKEDAINQAKLREELTASVLDLFPHLYVLKSPAFREEKEWRLISHLLWGRQDSSAFRDTRDRLIPFRAYELLELDRKPISRVILGPKHLTPPKVVQKCLEMAGYGRVKVVRSEASYR